MSKGTQVDERELAKQVDQNRRQDGVRPGHRLPEGFTNPEIGEPGHLCLDPKGNYRPTWFSVIIHQIDDSIGQTQYFAVNGNEYYVKTGTWVDVPPEVHRLLIGCTVNVIEQNYTEDDLRMGRPATRTVRKIPRFSFSAIASS